MKKVEAVIRPFTLEEIQEALTALGIDGMTVSEVKSLDHDTRSAFYRGTRYEVAGQIIALWADRAA